MRELTTDVLVVGGGVGGTAAAIQAARCKANTILVSEFSWLGGMLTSAGVSVPDGNELAAWQTGLWGSFLKELQERQPGGLDNSWVSFFSYEPRIGAEILADWVNELPNLEWVSGIPQSVLREGNRIVGVCFEDLTVKAKIILDGTELGDLLALGNIPHRWGWELQSEWGEPSAPVEYNFLTEKYPVQSPTWVAVMQDFGEEIAPEIPAAPNYDPSKFTDAWENYGPENFLNYGRLPGGRFMLNWPICGNDYGERLERLIESETAKQEFFQEAIWHSQNFAHFIQDKLGRRYGLAENFFPPQTTSPEILATSAFALHPYYRESRRLIGLTTIREQDILPLESGIVAPLNSDRIAIGNYANDHHYPDVKFLLQPKSIRWGGRWTGTPFTIPYRSLIPAEIDGFLVCEKNISVSHIANGATRLQPVVFGIGQAAGMAAAMCVELNCQPRDLPIKKLQEALLVDKRSPAAITPLFNLHPNHPDWLQWQKYYLDKPEVYEKNGYYPDSSLHKYLDANKSAESSHKGEFFTGIFQRVAPQDYKLTITSSGKNKAQSFQIMSLYSHIDQQLEVIANEQLVTVWGRQNLSGGWLLIEHIDE
ncbi:MAG: FAD-dependent oxidoreductase [Calothrix sp. SM1_7_51]|nr:FAD-dependent oxidoreductase [Calothrix sp. SM1_7_51]